MLFSLLFQPPHHSIRSNSLAANPSDSNFASTLKTDIVALFLQDDKKFNQLDIDAERVCMRISLITYVITSTFTIFTSFLLTLHSTVRSICLCNYS